MPKRGVTDVGRYLVGRLIQAVPLLLLLSLISFAILHLAPGDPAALLYGLDATPDDLAQVRARWGLDRPLPLQYLSWLGNVMRGNLGRSLADGRPVATTIGERLPATLLLAVSALAMAIVVGVGLGVVAAACIRSPLDRALTLVATLCYSMPTFWLGLLLILLFAITWGWLPSGGLASPVGPSTPVDLLAHLILPASVLSLPPLAQFLRFTRAGLSEVLGQGYVRTARAKGLGETAVLFRHAFRNAAIPLITLLGLALPQLLSGAVVVETVFAWPGLGRLIMEAAFQRNYSVLMGDILLVGSLVMLGSLIADVAYVLADPRIRYRSGS
jgi:peptide/nickel transport system permease protein